MRGKTAKQFGEYVTFKLHNDYFNNEETSTDTINAFDLMRTASMLNLIIFQNLNNQQIPLCSFGVAYKT